MQKDKPSRRDNSTLSLAKAAAVGVLGLIVAGFLLSGGENGNQNSAAVGDAPAAGDSDIDATADQRFHLKGLIFGNAARRAKNELARPAVSDSEDTTQIPARVADPGSVEAYIAESDDRGIHIGVFGRKGKHKSRVDDPLASYKNDEEADEESDTADEDEGLFDEVLVEEALYARNGSISGRVVNESGMPMVGIGVTATAIHLFDIPPNAQIPVGDLQRYAVSDTAGRYYFEQLVPGEYRVHNVPTADYGMSQIAVRTGVDFADIALKSQRAVTVSIIVNDTVGQPLSGVLVRPMLLGAVGGYTDSAGLFSLSMRIPSETRTVSLDASLHGYRDKITILGIEQFNVDQHASLRIQLEAIENQTFVTGIVVDGETGSPVAGKSVALSSTIRNDRYTATTGPDGSFTMPTVAAADGYELLIPGGGGYKAYQQPNVSVTLQGLELAVMLPPDEQRILAGRMVDLDGSPVPNFSMVVRAKKPPYQLMRVSSDGSGNFVLQNPPVGELVFESPSDPRLTVGGIQVNTSDQEQVTLRLDIGPNEIFGTLVDANGQPVSTPNVVLSWRQHYNGVVSSSIRRSAADSQGQFSFRGIGAGTRTVIVNADGFKPARIDHDAATEGYQFVIELEAESSS